LAQSPTISTGGSKDPYQKKLTRQQIFQQAYTLDQYAQEFVKELSTVNKQIAVAQRISSGEHIKLGDEGAAQVSVEDILNTHYEMLEAIEGAVGELRFMGEEIERRVNAAL
jgi:hypothetical protein